MFIVSIAWALFAVGLFSWMLANEVRPRWMIAAGVMLALFWPFLFIVEEAIK